MHPSLLPPFPTCAREVFPNGHTGGGCECAPVIHKQTGWCCRRPRSTQRGTHRNAGTKAEGRAGIRSPVASRPTEQKENQEALPRMRLTVTMGDNTPVRPRCLEGLHTED